MADFSRKNKRDVVANPQNYKYGRQSRLPFALAEDRRMRNKYEIPIISVTMLSMLLMIFSLSVIIVKQSIQDKYNKAEALKQNGRYPKIPQHITTGTYRVRTEASARSFGFVLNTQEGSGSACGIDLSEWGLTEHKFLLTAGHVVLQHNDDGITTNMPVDVIKIEVRVNSLKKWINCKILIVDKDRDIAILEAEDEVPVVFSLGRDAEVGAAIFVAGCPAGTTPSAVLGFLTSKDPEVPTSAKCRVWQASAPFFFGNSGGPIIDAETEKVIGVLVAGIGTRFGFVTNLIILIPCLEVRKMLDANLKLPEDHPVPKAEVMRLFPGQ